MQLSHAAAIVEGALSGNDHLFRGVSIDSRRTSDGDLFVAIPGDQHDGHDYVDQAAESGAVGALVSSQVGARLSQIRVEDTTRALGQLGAHWRRGFNLPVVAITGSNGKTTVAALAAAILNNVGNCLHPHGSFNNQWGVPLTLLRLRASHTHAVIELGMNHPGEIDYLTGLVRPTIALINNVAPAHLEGLGTLENVAAAKAEIFNGLQPGGIAILNCDDPFYEVCRDRVGVGNILSFGTHHNASIGVSKLAADVYGSNIELNVEGQAVALKLPLLGMHNTMNAAAAAAAAYAAGADLQAIKFGLESFVAVTGRLQTVRGRNGALIIDDSYNANPASTSAALEVLRDCGGNRIAVLGAMAELGENSDQLHFEVGRCAHDFGIDQLLCLGPEEHRGIDNYLDGFGGGARRFNSIDGLLDYLDSLLEENTVVLVKGSRSSSMERVVAALIGQRGGGAAC